MAGLKCLLGGDYTVKLIIIRSFIVLKIFITRGKKVGSKVYPSFKNSRSL